MMVKSAILSVLVLALGLLSSCYGDTNEVLSEDARAFLIAKSMEHTDLIGRLARNDEYISLTIGSGFDSAVTELLADIGANVQGVPDSAFLLFIPENAVRAPIEALMDVEAMDSDIVDFITKRMLQFVFQMINARDSGIDWLIATSVLSLSGAYHQPNELDGAAFVLLFYEGHTSATLFMNTGGDVVTANSSIICLPDEFSLDDDTIHLLLFNFFGPDFFVVLEIMQELKIYTEIIDRNSLERYNDRT